MCSKGKCFSIAFEGLGFEESSISEFALIIRVAVRCYKKCGFRREGVVRRRLGPDDQIRVVTLMTILRSDFMRFEAVS